MSHQKQFTLYTHLNGPNGWKVALVLEELGLSYESLYLDFFALEHKKAPHVLLNPNGRIPTLVDHHNGDFALWESNAIIMYLADKYDTERRISFGADAAGEKDRATLVQWLFFQASGQAPYFGQIHHFIHTHPEKVPSAVTRYQNEAMRVFGVLDGVLAQRPADARWLVGGKCTVADLAFVQWNEAMYMFDDLPEGFDMEKQFPALYIWHMALKSRESWKNIVAVRKNLLEKA